MSVIVILFSIQNKQLITIKLEIAVAYNNT